MINGLIAVIGLLAAAFCFYRFQTVGDTTFGVLAAIAALVAVIFGVMFLSGRINKTEDIHITE
jgi:4-amino-4-deoxy-L-arabinose transferase-like glycosyltransferase